MLVRGKETTDEHIIREAFHFQTSACIRCFIQHLHRAVTYGVRELKRFMFNDSELTRHFLYLLSIPSRVSVILTFPLSARVVSTERDGGTSPLSANESRLQRIRVVYARVIKRRYARGKRTTGVGNVGLQQRWELTLTRISLRQPRAFATSSVSSNPRPRCVTTRTYTRAHYRRVICTKAEARASV